MGFKEFLEHAEKHPKKYEEIDAAFDAEYDEYKKRTNKNLTEKEEEENGK